MNNIVNINYPREKYILLNENIEKLISKYLNEFLYLAKGVEQPYFDYTLNIEYQKYNYETYLSYVFFISMYTGGAHPNNLIETINYDIKNNKIIDIEYLTKNNKNILNKLSQESYKILSKNKEFQVNEDIFAMLKEGTSPKIENFRNIAFSNDGLIVYFEQYQIAPYSFGKFKITIPYWQLKWNNLLLFLLNLWYNRLKVKDVVIWISVK